MNKRKILRDPYGKVTGYLEPLNKSMSELLKLIWEGDKGAMGLESVGRVRTTGEGRAYVFQLGERGGRLIYEFNPYNPQAVRVTGNAPEQCDEVVRGLNILLGGVEVKYIPLSHPEPAGAIR